MRRFQDDSNPGVSTKFTHRQTLADVRARSGINQIRGINNSGATGSGIPQHVTDVRVMMANAQTGSTSAVTVLFHRDPSDTAFSGVVVLAKGYQSNQSPVQIASSADSPCTFILNNTGEAVSLVVQAQGNGGQAPLDSAPTVGVRLPKSTGGGVGTTTTVTPPTVSGSASPGQIAVFATPATTLTGGNLSGDVVTSGGTSTTVQKIQGDPVSSSAPKIGDVLEWSGTQWSLVPPRFSVRGFRAPMNSTAIASSHPLGGLTPIGTANVNVGTDATATEPRLLAVATAGTAQTVTCGVEEAPQSTGGTTLGILTRFVARVRGNQTTNVRYWIGLLDGTVNLTNTAFFASDTPNQKYVGFRYSSTTDSVWKATAGTATANQTVVSTGVSVDTTNTQLFEIIFDGTNANFYINGAAVGQISTNLPTTSAKLRAAVLVDNKNTANTDTVSYAHVFVLEKF